MAWFRAVLEEAPRNHPADVAPVTRALVEDGRISSGHPVLDIATGPGAVLNSGMHSSTLPLQTVCRSQRL
jgi:hypothetical protein